MHAAGIGGMPQAKGIAARLDGWLAEHADMPGADFLVIDGEIRNQELQL